jgi:hypothetical protein
MGGWVKSIKTGGGKTCGMGLDPFSAFLEELPSLYYHILPL